MKKIPTIFKRNPRRDRRQEVLPEQNPECAWVFKGEGVATRKYDGTCCLVKDKKLWKRREVKRGKPTPSDFVPLEHDPVTGKTVGWVPVDANDKSDRWHIEAFADMTVIEDGTYELCGPKVQGNPEGCSAHTLIPHAKAQQYPNVPRTFEGIRDFLADTIGYLDIEGLVFHHPDGRMAKIKTRDFGLRRP